MDPGDVAFYEEDGLTRMAIPAEKLREGWKPVLAYLRELRQQVIMVLPQLPIMIIQNVGTSRCWPT